MLKVGDKKAMRAFSHELRRRKETLLGCSRVVATEVLKGVSCYISPHSMTDLEQVGTTRKVLFQAPRRHAR